MRRVRPLVFSLLFGAATGLQGKQLPVRIYSTAEGLAGNRVDCIVPDSRGFLWFCTNEGLSRFDGYQFTNFGVDQGLPVPVHDLLATRSGEYWVATDDGLVRFNPSSSGSRFSVYRPKESEAGAFRALAEDGAGGVCCGTERGLYHLQHVARDPQSPGAGHWILRFVDIGTPEPVWMINALLLDRAGSLWIAGDGLTHLFADGRCIRYTTRDGLPHEHVSDLLEDRDGRLWVGTWGGLCRISMDRGATGPLVEKVYRDAGGIDAMRESSRGAYGSAATADSGSSCDATGARDLKPIHWPGEDVLPGACSIQGRDPQDPHCARLMSQMARPLARSAAFVRNQSGKPTLLEG